LKSDLEDAYYSNDMKGDLEMQVVAYATTITSA